MAKYLWFLFGFLFWAGIADAAPAGSVLRVQGRAEALAPDGARALVPGGGVATGETLRTGEESRLEVRLLDGTVLTLGAEAHLVVDQLVYDPAGPGGSGTLRLVEGAFLLAGGALAKLDGHPLTVRTPTASIGIRGTRFWGGPLAGLSPAGPVPDPLAFGVLLLEGRITVANEAGRVDLDDPGAGTTVERPGAAPSPPARWSDERVRNAFATVTFR